MAKLIAKDICKDFIILPGRDYYIYAVPRGGIAPTYILLNFLPKNFLITDDIKNADIIVDDIEDSGATKNELLQLNLKAKFYAFYKKLFKYCIFPWEKTLNDENMTVDTAILRLSQYYNIEDNKFNQFKDFILNFNYEKL